MMRLTIFTSAVLAGFLGTVMLTNFLGETSRPAASAGNHSGTAAALAGAVLSGGQQLWGDLDCDADIDGIDALAALRNVAALEALPQIEPCADVGARSGNQADSVRFQLFPEVVYCGVQSNAEPYVLDVAVSSPAGLTDPENPTSPPKPGHDGAGWLDVEMQEPNLEGFGQGKGLTYNVPSNSSFDFALTLGGVPGVDQLVRISTPPKGDESGGGAAFTGFASVHAQGTAQDPFIGDNRDDNFCVAIGFPDAGQGEFVEADISTTLPVPDGWVLDNDGSDGGVLRSMPH